MTGRSKAAVASRVARTKARGQYRYDNMTKVEKAAYVVKFGAPPAPDNKVGGKPARTSKNLEAYRKWAAQAPGQHRTLMQLR